MDTELTSLQNAIVLAEEKQNKDLVNHSQIKKIIKILQDFLIHKQLICYGGTAINNILPHDLQFYDLTTEIPDYDFYSKTPLADAKELADIYFNLGEGFQPQAKAGIHEGTFKVYVDYIPIADITYLPEPIYNAIKKDVIVRDQIHYAPANFLKMNMYIELSRPDGDTTRWEKVYKRLQLLNEAYPDISTQCTKSAINAGHNSLVEFISTELNDVVFLSGISSDINQVIDLLSEQPDETANKIKEYVKSDSVSSKKPESVSIENHASLGEIIPRYVTVLVDNTPIVHIYEPIACHNYNETTYHDYKIKVATTDTMLNFYLAFLYIGNDLAHKRVECMVHSIFKQERQHKSKRFSLNCIGKQETLLDIRKKKADKFIELEGKKKTPEYEWWFLNYVPHRQRRSTKFYRGDNKINESIKKKRRTHKKRSYPIANIFRKRALFGKTTLKWRRPTPTLLQGIL